MTPSMRVDDWNRHPRATGSGRGHGRWHPWFLCNFRGLIVVLFLPPQLILMELVVGSIAHDHIIMYCQLEPMPKGHRQR